MGFLFIVSKPVYTTYKIFRLQKIVDFFTSQVVESLINLSVNKQAIVKRITSFEQSLVF